MKNYNAEHAVDSEPAHLARRFGTPLLVIDERLLRETMQRFVDAFSHPTWKCDVVYAAKALDLKAILAIASDEGLLLDVCSEGELEAAISAGVSPGRCLLHGCAKTARELELAVQAGVGWVVVDHRDEIAALAKIAQRAGARTPVLVRLNPAVKASTKSQIQTGGADSKFGFPIADGQARAAVKAVLDAPRLEFVGIHCHIGSQIRDLASYALASERMARFAIELARDLSAACRVINMGGGIDLESSNDGAAAHPSAWARTIFEQFERSFGSHAAARPRRMVEPGRAIVSRAGSTLYTILVRKTLADGSTALIVDGGMSDNPRPALYEAVYSVTLAGRSDDQSDERYTIFGRHCETDLLFRDVPLADPQPDDILQVHNTGAYTYSMASNYNRFPRPAVVLVNGARARLIAKREPLGHLLDLDVVETSPLPEADA